MEQTITIRLKLRTPTRNKQERLLRQQDTYLQACNYFLQQARQLEIVSLGKLHRSCYKSAVKLFNLNAAILQQAMGKVIAAKRSVFSRLAKGEKTGDPIFDRTLPVMYRNDTFKIITINKGFGIRLPTASGRSIRTFPVEVGEYQRHYLTLLESGSARQGSGELLQSRSGDWYFHLTLVIQIEKQESKEVLGVDLGVVKLATIASPDGQFTKFFDGKPIRWKRERRAKKRAYLQTSGRLARVKKMRGKETRWMTYHNHVISKQIVAEAKKREATIILEDLAGIRDRSKMSKRSNRMIASWAFCQLVNFIQYKANLLRVSVRFIDPRNTSTTCSRCGHCEKGNRKNQADFHCLYCSYRSNADRNAAKNIASLGSMALEHISKVNGSVTPRRAQDQDDLVQANPSSSLGSLRL